MPIELYDGVIVRVSPPVLPRVRAAPPSPTTVTILPVSGPVGPTGGAGPPGPTGPAGGVGYHHAQLAAAEEWTITHGLGYRPGGILAKDSIGEIVEPADVVYVDTTTTLRLTFPGHPMSGTADVS